MVLKRHDDERIGLGEVWFVDPNPGHQVVLAYQRKMADEPFVAIEARPDEVLASPLLEGFELRFERLFER